MRERESARAREIFVDDQSEHLGPDEIDDRDALSGQIRSFLSPLRVEYLIKFDSPPPLLAQSFVSRQLQARWESERVTVRAIVSVSVSACVRACVRAGGRA